MLLNLYSNFVNFSTSFFFMIKTPFSLSKTVLTDMFSDLCNVYQPIRDGLIEVSNQVGDIDWIEIILFIVRWRDDRRSRNNCVTQPQKKRRVEELLI